jgi:hypothetical protein
MASRDMDTKVTLVRLMPRFAMPNSQSPSGRQSGKWLRLARRQTMLAISIGLALLFVYQTVGGLAIYLGVLPAQLVQGHTETTMHGGVPRRPHQHHLVVALFDAATGARITDAEVTALVSGAGHRDDRKRLEAMVIADTTTYGQYFDFPDAGRYTIRVDVRRGNQAAPVTARFTYQHSLR